MGEEDEAAGIEEGLAYEAYRGLPLVIYMTTSLAQKISR